MSGKVEILVDFERSQRNKLGPRMSEEFVPRKEKVCPKGLSKFIHSAQVHCKPTLCQAWFYGASHADTWGKKPPGQRRRKALRQKSVWLDKAAWERKRSEEGRK